MGITKIGQYFLVCPFLKFCAALYGELLLHEVDGGHGTHLNDRVNQEDSLCAEGFDSFLRSCLAHVSIFLKFGHLFAHIV
jgi:hypothetical protein